MAGELAPHRSGYQITGLSTSWILFISSIFWVPYTLFLLYLFYEHKSRKQFPQYFILGFLAAGAFCRCLWLFLEPYDANGTMIISLLNRFAILFQFSAITLLMLMWDRALTVTSNVDRSVAALSHQEKQPMAIVLRRALNTNGRGWANNAANAPPTKATDRSLFWKHWACVVINVAAYSFVLLTTLLVYNDPMWYTVNLVSIAVLCLLVDVGIMKVGLSNWYRLRQELTPVYQSNSRGTSAQQMPSEHSWTSYICSCGGLGELFKSTDRLSSRLFSGSNAVAGAKSLGFSLQAQVIRVVLSVSLTVSFFFLIRAFCFTYFPLYMDKGNPGIGLGNVAYPLFFYQLPELFPNLAIAVAISPPKSICRVLLFCCGGRNKWQRNVSRGTVMSGDLVEESWWKRLFCCSWCKGQRHRSIKRTGTSSAPNSGWGSPDQHPSRRTFNDPQAEGRGESSFIGARGRSGTWAARLSVFFAMKGSQSTRESAMNSGNHPDKDGMAFQDQQGEFDNAAAQTSIRAEYTDSLDWEGGGHKLHSSHSLVELSASIGTRTTEGVEEPAPHQPQHLESTDQDSNARAMERQQMLLEAMEEFLYNASAIPADVMKQRQGDLSKAGPGAANASINAMHQADVESSIQPPSSRIVAVSDGDGMF